jgi:hypothetical protein
MRNKRSIRSSSRPRRSKRRSYKWQIILMTIIVGIVGLNLLVKKTEKSLTATEIKVEAVAPSSLQESISQATSLAVIKSGEKYHVVTFKDKIIFEDSISKDVALESMYQLSDEQVVVMSTNAGHNGCATTYRLISIKNDIAQIYKLLAPCTDAEVNKEKGDGVILEFDDGFGKKLVSRYKNGVISEYKVTSPLSYDPQNSQEGFAYLRNADVEKILTDMKLQPMLRKMMAGDFERLIKRLEVSSIETTDKNLVISGLAAHKGGEEEAVLVIPIDGTKVLAAAIFTHELSTPLPSITAYSNAVAGDIYPDAEMNKWLDRFKGQGIHGNK